MNRLTKLGIGIMSIPVLAFIIMILLDSHIDVVTGTMMVMTYFSGLGLSIQRNNAPQAYEDYVEPEPVKVILIESLVPNPQPVSFSPDETFHFKSRKTTNARYFFLWDYYPKKKYPELEDELYWQRMDIWSFKDGLNSITMARNISSALINQFTKPRLSEYHLAIIPASTSDATTQRFRSFVSYVASYTGMQEGFDIVKNSANREAIHYQDNRQIDYSNHITIGDALGKDIMLFDDVITTGRSFRSIRKLLLKNGARSVTGIFLAKTYCK